MLEKYSKAIVCSDLHIDEWSYYKPSKEQMKDKLLNPLNFKNIDEFRLNQSLLLARRLVKLSKDYETPYIFILGDLVNRAKHSPKVFHTLIKFMNILNKNGCIVFFICGQHDMFSRVKDIDIRDTFVTSLCNKNIRYVNGEQFSFGKHFIEFQNFDFSNTCQFKDNTTVALGHISLGMGQLPKGKSLKLCIAGDIHDLVEGTSTNGNGNKFKYYSCCTPYQLYPHQPDDGYIGLLDCSKETPTYTRINSDGEIFIIKNGEETSKLWKTLKLKETNDYINSAVNQSITETQIELTKGEKESVTESFNVKDTNKIIEEIKSLVKEKGYDDLFNQLDLSEIPTPISFDFKLKSIIINNFRSIKDIKINFDDYLGSTYIGGKNGAGKSSILLALITALFGDKFIKKYQKKNADELYLNLILEYNGHSYCIERGVGWSAFYHSDKLNIDNEDESWISYDYSKKEIENKIYDNLPFLYYLHYFICYANSHFFDNVDRTQLIMDVFNLNSIEYIKNCIYDLQYDIKENIKKFTTDCDTLRGQVDYSNRVIKDIQGKIDNLLKDKDKYIDIADKKYDELVNLNLDINSCVRDCNSIKVNLDTVTNTFNTYANEDNYKKALASKNFWFEHDQYLLKVINKQQEDRDLDTQWNTLSNVIVKLKQIPKCKCPKCSFEFYNGTDEEDINNKINERKEIEDKRKVLCDEIELLMRHVPKLTDNLFDKNEYETYITKYESCKGLLSQKEKLEKEYKESVEKGKKLYEKKEALLKSFNCKDENTYKELLLNSIKYKSQIDTLRKSYDENLKEYNTLSKQLKDTEKKLEQLNENYSRCDSFASIFDMSNLESIPYSIIDKVIHSLDTDYVKFSSTKELANGEDRFEISAEIKVDENLYINYDDASDGQKCVLDLFILKALFNNIGKVGLLILDEFCANLDEVNINQVELFLNNIKKYINNILMTSHSNLFTGYDNRINLELHNGETIITK